MLKLFKSDLRLVCFHLRFKLKKKLKYLLNYVGLKQGIAAIVIYITIFALLVRIGLKTCCINHQGPS